VFEEWEGGLAFAACVLVTTTCYYSLPCWPSLLLPQPVSSRLPTLSQSARHLHKEAQLFL
jgi:hypothetical protein